jgi:hypothetical protein
MTGPLLRKGLRSQLARLAQSVQRVAADDEDLIELAHAHSRKVDDLDVSRPGFGHPKRNGESTFDELEDECWRWPLP